MRRTLGIVERKHRAGHARKKPSGTRLAPRQCDAPARDPGDRRGGSPEVPPPSVETGDLVRATGTDRFRDVPVHRRRESKCHEDPNRRSGERDEREATEIGGAENTCKDDRRYDRVDLGQDAAEERPQRPWTDARAHRLDLGLASGRAADVIHGPEARLTARGATFARRRPLQAQWARGSRRQNAYQTEEPVLGEPMLLPLGAEVIDEELSLPACVAVFNRHEQRRCARISVVLGHLVLEHWVISKRVPCELAGDAMIWCTSKRVWTKRMSGDTTFFSSSKYSLTPGSWGKYDSRRPPSLRSWDASPRNARALALASSDRVPGALRTIQQTWRFGTSSTSRRIVALQPISMSSECAPIARTVSPLLCGRSGMRVSTMLRATRCDEVLLGRSWQRWHDRSPRPPTEEPHLRRATRACCDPSVCRLLVRQEVGLDRVGLWPRQMMKSRCPKWAKYFMMCQRIGRPPTSTSGSGSTRTSRPSAVQPATEEHHFHGALIPSDEHE